MYWLAYIEWRSSVDVVVKLLACGAICPEFDSWSRRYGFQRLVISCFQLAILPKYQPTNIYEYEYEYTT